jgi:hypothetical protein
LTRALAEAAGSFTKVFHALLCFFPHNVAPDFLQYVSKTPNQRKPNRKGKNKMKQPVHMKTTLRRALGRAVPGKLSGRHGVLAEEGALQRFFKKKGDVGQ